MTIFSKIINKEIPAHIIYEDNKFLAFLDVNPLVFGHTLLIPKKPTKWVWDVEDFEEYFSTARKIIKHYQNVTGNELVTMKVVGTDVPHAHIHIMPYDEKYSGDTHQLTDEEAEKALNLLKLN